MKFKKRLKKIKKLWRKLSCKEQEHIMAYCYLKLLSIKGGDAT